MATQVAQRPAPGVEIAGPMADGYGEILSADAIAFLADLQRMFNRRRLELLAKRDERKKRIDAGEMPDFLPETRKVRDSDWTVAPIPADLRDRRV